MTLLLIHRLTGGEWGQAAAPVLRPAAAMFPLVALAFVPVLVGLPQIYPWAADPVRNTGAMSADGISASLSFASAVNDRADRLVGARLWSSPPVAEAVCLPGSGLAFFGLTISLVAVDWYPVAGAALRLFGLCGHDRNSAIAGGTRRHGPDRRRRGSKERWRETSARF